MYRGICYMLVLLSLKKEKGLILVIKEVLCFLQGKLFLVLQEPSLFDVDVCDTGKEIQMKMLGFLTEREKDGMAEEGSDFLIWLSDSVLSCFLSFCLLKA